MILMIDNYDSFTYNLVQYLGELGANLKVFRNDALTIADIKKMNPEKIVISPGPGRPKNAGISVEIVKEFAGKIPILGVCLGHQAIGYAYGGKIVSAKKIMHGKTSQIHHDNKSIFKGLENPFEATRYHSLVIDKKTLADCFEVVATTKESDGNAEIMAIKHKKHKLFGVQFHQESILTKEGKNLLKNFLEI
ncbi:MAG: aminodeoxychorismate/anthranilate synthase component II [Candidatus Zapsychrus exili]|nr:aminodeoxychorismate/anthranilate synthase component II [Candidatus Zapsychrus exili]